MPDNLYSRFVTAAADPEKPFLLLPDDQPLSFRDVFARAGRFAHVLVARGKPGDRVAVQGEKSPAVLILYLACLGRAPSICR